jgi:uncharacterized protein YkwD
LRLEELEPRQLLSGSPPTAVEQLFLEQLNDARANPAAYGANIGLDLSAVAPSQPLAFQPELIQAARLHSQDMNDRGYFAHNTPEGTDPGQRITAAGFSWTGWGESIAGGNSFPGPSEALRGLIIDTGVPDLGHRRHLLAIDAVFKDQNQVGIGVVQSGTGPLTNYYTIDTASTRSNSPFITGVVYNDTNGNGKYDIGEGLGGVTITVASVGSTTSFDSGGYRIAVDPGTYTVTASGGGLAVPITQTVTVGTSNVRLSFTVGNDDYIQKLYRTILSRLAGPGEVAAWRAVLQGPAGPNGVASGIEHSTEARRLLVRRWYETYLGRTPGNGEEQGWVAGLMQGAREEDVLTGLLGSDEFFNRANTVNASGKASENYIQSLYTVLLHRSASAGEMAGWLAALPGSGRANVVMGFLQSAEYRGDVVGTYYTGLLHRKVAPTAGEVNIWVFSGLDFMSMRVGFESSREFMLNG